MRKKAELIQNTTHHIKCSRSRRVGQKAETKYSLERSAPLFARTSVQPPRRNHPYHDRLMIWRSAPGDHSKIAFITIGTLATSTRSFHIQSIDSFSPFNNPASGLGLRSKMLANNQFKSRQAYSSSHRDVYHTPLTLWQLLYVLPLSSSANLLPYPSIDLRRSIPISAHRGSTRRPAQRILSLADPSTTFGGDRLLFSTIRRNPNSA